MNINQSFQIAAGEDYLVISFCEEEFKNHANVIQIKFTMEEIIRFNNIVSKYTNQLLEKNPKFKS